jgi:trk system potassium uptake protein TrkA
VVNAENEAAQRWAHRLTLPRLERYIELGEDHSLVYMAAPGEFCQKTPAKLGLRKRYGVNLLAIRRVALVEVTGRDQPTETETVIVPKPDTEILPGDVLIFVGSNESLSSLPAG